MTDIFFIVSITGVILCLGVIIAGITKDLDGNDD